MQFSFKSFLPHILVILGFVVASLLYFSPVLQGKQIYQSDIVQYTGMAKQQNDFRVETGQETFWTNSAFGGMPTYLLGAKYPHNYIKKLDHTLRFLPRPADYLFLYLISFYILLLVLRVDFKLAVLGALAFGFSTYLIIILGVGHNAKAHAIAYMPLVLAGIILTFQKRYIFGFLLTAIALGLELSANHPQMTYYLMLLVLVLGATYLFDAYQKKLLPHFFKSVGILVVSVIFAVALNATNFMAMNEYAKYSERGPSELTVNADGSPKEKSSGLDRAYITEYSYGLFESFNLFVPRLIGGGSYEDVGDDSHTYEAFRKLGATSFQALQEAQQTPTYWGKQKILEAPAYVGAVIIFLFVLALFLVRGRLKWWLVAGVLMSLILSWGKNWFWGPEGDPLNNPITNLMIDYFPLYNKFRAVSSIQVILELCIPILAIFGLSRLLNDFEQKEDKLKALKFTTIITVGCVILLLLVKSSFDFNGLRDSRYLSAYGDFGPEIIKAYKADRMALYTQDTLRTLVLVLASASVIWFFLKKKLSELVLVLVFGVLIVFDLVSIDRNYVNTDDFVVASRVERPYQANTADVQILKDKSHYRVFDMTAGNTRPSYFHNSLSGYTAAKMRRYNELFDFHIVKQNLQVLNMLNTKYLIGEQEEQMIAFTNNEANGNAWFIEELEQVANADAEIRALDSLQTKQNAVFVKPEKTKINLGAKFVKDSLALIKLIDYKPNYLKYQSNNVNDGFAVFSENYYKHGWQAFIDGKEVPHFRVNYVLRGLSIPKGEHAIEFKFEPQVIKTGSSIALGSSILIAVLVLGGLFLEFKKK